IEKGIRMRIRKLVPRFLKTTCITNLTNLPTVTWLSSTV
uniref:Uncharacterized protein n=1 Tax=Amphimedon queenslandica TaxID=400682 RepID=A0A1X7SZQ3_AMPQE